MERMDVPETREGSREVGGADTRAARLAAESGAVVARHAVDPREDMDRERARASFPASELETALAGGAEVAAMRRAAAAALRADPAFNKAGKYFWAREELHARTVRMQLATPAKAKAVARQTGFDEGEVYRHMRLLVDEPGPLDLHLGMFIPTIEGMGDEDQRQRWLPDAKANRIIGTYAQTELGHGTYLRGLETTATYDERTMEWVIDSPTLSSTKWWPGGLGKTATHVICMARLFTKGSDHGPHPFVVQIRSLEDHRPVAGVEVGDIGPKLGYNAMDNGFLRFSKLRVPRRAMLMRHAKVAEDGSYTSPPVEKASYGTMVFVRSDIVMNAALYLQKAVTVAVRYGASRRQSGGGPDAPELQVLDYQHSQRTLFSLLSTCFAFHFASGRMRQQYFEFEAASRESGDFSALPELHATSSGLKAVCTWRTKEGIELCRLACGGHGFMALSGLPTTLGTYAPNVTYEGENNVLLLQTARFLLKAARAAASGAPLRGDAAYLAELRPSGKPSPLGERAQTRDPAALLDAYAHRAARLVREAAARAGGGATAEAAMQADQVAWIRAAAAHCEYVLLGTFIRGLEDAREAGAVSTSTLLALHRQLALFALTGIEDKAGEWLVDGHLSGAQLGLVQAEVGALLGEVRPDAVALTDAFGLDDYFLDSALGAYDGDYMGRLYRGVQDAPFNASHLPPGYEQNLAPVLGGSAAPRSRM